MKFFGNVACISWSAKGTAFIYLDEFLPKIVRMWLIMPRTKLVDWVMDMQIFSRVNSCIPNCIRWGGQSFQVLFFPQFKLPDKQDPFHLLSWVHMCVCVCGCVILTVLVSICRLHFAFPSPFPFLPLELHRHQCYPHSLVGFSSCLTIFRFFSSFRPTSPSPIAIILTGFCWFLADWVPSSFLFSFLLHFFFLAPRLPSFFLPFFFLLYLCLCVCVVFFFCHSHKHILRHWKRERRTRARGICKVPTLANVCVPRFWLDTSVRHPHTCDTHPHTHRHTLTQIHISWPFGGSTHIGIGLAFMYNSRVRYIGSTPPRQVRG